METRRLGAKARQHSRESEAERERERGSKTARHSVGAGSMVAPKWVNDSA